MRHKMHPTRHKRRLNVIRAIAPGKQKPRGVALGPKPILDDSLLRATIMNMAKAGLSQAAIAKFTGVSEDTITRRKRTDKPFAEALDDGRAHAVAFALARLIANVRRGNQRAIEYYLNNSIGWGDRSFVEDHGASVQFVGYEMDPSSILRVAGRFGLQPKPQEGVNE